MTYVVALDYNPMLGVPYILSLVLRCISFSVDGEYHLDVLKIEACQRRKAGVVFFFSGRGESGC